MSELPLQMAAAEKCGIGHASTLDRSVSERHITFRPDVWFMFAIFMGIHILILVTGIITWTYVPESTRTEPFEGNKFSQDWGYLITACYTFDFSPARQIGAFIYLASLILYFVYNILNVAHTDMLASDPNVTNIGEKWRKFRVYSAIGKFSGYSLILGSFLWSPMEDAGGFYSMNQLIFLHAFGHLCNNVGVVVNEWERIIYAIHTSYDLGDAVVPFHDWFGKKTIPVLGLGLVMMTLLVSLLSIVEIFWMFGYLEVIYNKDDLLHRGTLRSIGALVTLYIAIINPMVSWKLMKHMPPLFVRTSWSGIEDYQRAHFVNEFELGRKKAGEGERHSETNKDVASAVL